LAWGRPEEGPPREQTAGVDSVRGGGSSAMIWRGGRAWELHWNEMKPFPRSIGAEGGWKWELDGARTAGGHGEQRQGETARRARRQRAEGEDVRVASKKASSRRFGNERHGSRR